MSLDSLVKLVVTVAVFEMMVAVGLGVAVADVIATDVFAGTPAVTALMAYGLVGITGSLVLASCWSRLKGLPMQDRTAVEVDTF